MHFLSFSFLCSISALAVFDTYSPHIYLLSLNYPPFNPIFFFEKEFSLLWEIET